jgi:hypothetical protein
MVMNGHGRSAERREGGIVGDLDHELAGYLPTIGGTARDKSHGSEHARTQAGH